MQLACWTSLECRDLLAGPKSKKEREKSPAKLPQALSVVPSLFLPFFAMWPAAKTRIVQLDTQLQSQRGNLWVTGVHTVHTVLLSETLKQSHPVKQCEQGEVKGCFCGHC